MLNYSWSEDYSVSNPVLDDHHKNLLHLFNEAYELIINDASSDKTIKIISELRIYSIFHFNEEEKLMKQSNYPLLEAHIQEHQKFIEDVTKFKKSISTENRALNEEIFIFLSDWLVSHIQKTDKLYVHKI